MLALYGVKLSITQKQSMKQTILDKYGVKLSGTRQLLKERKKKLEILNKINKNMDKIIFLDIDGVLNVYAEGRDEFGSTFHKHLEDNLRWIIEETGAKIVISSTWRIDGLKRMQEMWEKRGLPGEVIGVTPTETDVVDSGTCEFYDLVDRGHEIQQYINDNGIECYVILDDDNDMLPSQRNNFVRTANNIDHPDCVDIGYGLTRKCSGRAIEILNSK